MNEKLILISGAVLFKEYRGKRLWFLVKEEKDGNWEIPKVVVRKTESSARAAMRIIAEQGGMSSKVLEEAGRAGGVTTINGKILPQRYVYYLLMHSSEGEVLGFADYIWLEYAKAVRKLSSKRERLMIKRARQELRKWERKQQKLNQ